MNKISFSKKNCNIKVVGLAGVCGKWPPAGSPFFTKGQEKRLLFLRSRFLFSCFLRSCSTSPKIFKEFRHHIALHFRKNIRSIHIFCITVIDIPQYIVCQDYSRLRLITSQFDVEETIKALYGMLTYDLHTHFANSITGQYH